jgi:hypothetical protein
MTGSPRSETAEQGMCPGMVHRPRMMLLTHQMRGIFFWQRQFRRCATKQVPSDKTAFSAPGCNPAMRRLQTLVFPTNTAHLNQ